jgi:hypothetical protein
MHSMAIVVAVDPPGTEAEDPDQPVVGSRDIAVDQQCDAGVRGVRGAHFVDERCGSVEV